MKANNQLATVSGAFAQLGQAANKAASRGVFPDYMGRKAANTTRRQAADLALFTEFIQITGVVVGDLQHDPQAWKNVTWGLVEAWQKWQLQKGYAVASVNVRLSTVKTYARLAVKAQALKESEYAMIRLVNGYQHKEIKHVDDQRKEAGTPTRCGSKKARAVSLTPEQAKALKTQPNTPQGRRDALLMCIMLDLGLRVGEVAILTVDNFNLRNRELTFYRPKVNKVQTHRLINGSLAAARAYMDNGAPAIGVIWRGSASKSDGADKFQADELTGQGWSTRCITERVRVLGEAIGVHGLSAHDCRHYWATQAARNHTQMDRLQDAGGWSSLAMPARYIEAAKIANEGVNLGTE